MTLCRTADILHITLQVVVTVFEYIALILYSANEYFSVALVRGLQAISEVFKFFEIVVYDSKLTKTIENTNHTTGNNVVV